MSEKDKVGGEEEATDISRRGFVKLLGGSTAVARGRRRTGTTGQCFSFRIG